MTEQQSQTISPQNVDTRGAPAVPRLMLVLIAITVLTSAASLMVSRDLLLRDQVHMTLQIAASRAAMAGVAYLPGWPTRAVRAAEQSVALSGLQRSSMIEAAVAPNRMSFRVALKCEAPVFFLRVLHDAEVDAVSIAAVPPQSGWPAIFRNRLAPRHARPSGEERPALRVAALK